VIIIKNFHIYQLRFFCFFLTLKRLHQIPQPGIVSAICDLLCLQGKLSLLHREGADNVLSRYFAKAHPELKTNLALQKYLNRSIGCLIYGFKYAYEVYKVYVKPIEYTDREGDIALGSCFLYRGGIATAKHCIEGASRIGIQGLTKEQLDSAKYLLHSNSAIDLVFIKLEIPLVDTAPYGDQAEILDEVMAMGYPMVPGYHNFLTAETATVSARFTTSVGQIAASAEDIWMREQLFLITARIRGGNSGGPIIKKNGNFAGISVNLAQGDGKYDDLGYGTVIPISLLDEIIDNEAKMELNINNITFKTFE